MTRPARPYQGTRIIPIRLADDLVAEIQAAIVSNNKQRREEELNVSDWIRIAIRERLAKLARGRKGAQKKDQESGQVG